MCIRDRSRALQIGDRFSATVLPSEKRRSLRTRNGAARPNIAKKTNSFTRENSPVRDEPPRIDDATDHLDARLGQRLFQQQPKPRVLLLVDGDDEHGIFWVEQLLGELQPTFHE